MGTLIAWGIGLAVVIGGYGVWHHNVYSQGEAAGIAGQLKADKPIFDRCIAERDQSRDQEKAREAETASCKAKVDTQNAGIDRLTAASAALIAQARKEAAARSTANAIKQQEIDRLQAQAAQANAKKGTSDEQLKGTDSTLDGALRSLRK